MGSITVSLPTDGTTADVADVNTPITTIVNAINGGLDNDNIASGAAIDGSKLADATVTNAKLSTAAGEVGAAWASVTPTLTASSSDPTIGNSTISGWWTRVGKTVTYRARLVIGSTFSVGSGSYRFSLPVAAGSNQALNSSPMVSGVIVDVSAPETGLICGGKLITTTTLEVFAAKAGSISNLQSAYPFAWATGDTIEFTVIYEGA